MKAMKWIGALWLGALVTVSGTLLAQGEMLSSDRLVNALRDGGYVIVMRHANSPREAPDGATANPDNRDRERQLDAAGREAARTMGEALRRLAIPVTEVHSSPTYRALETARLMGFEDVATNAELSNEGMRDSGEAYGAWLREQAEQAPVEGNRLLITHAPNMRAGFGELAGGMGEGDALVFKPNDNGEGVLVGKVAITEWAEL